NLVYHGRGHGPAVGQFSAVLHPLPDLGAADLGGGRVFHQVVNWNAADAAQPGFQVLNPHVDVPAQTSFGDGTVGHGQQVLGGDVHLFALARDLIGAFHVLVED